MKCCNHDDLLQEDNSMKTRKTRFLETTPGVVDKIHLDIVGNEWQMTSGIVGDLGSGTLFGNDCLTRDQVLMIKLNEVIKAVNKLIKEDNDQN